MFVLLITGYCAIGINSGVWVSSGITINNGIHSLLFPRYCHMIWCISVRMNCLSSVMCH